MTEYLLILQNIYLTDFFRLPNYYLKKPNPDKTKKCLKYIKVPKVKECAFGADDFNFFWLLVTLTGFKERGRNNFPK